MKTIQVTCGGCQTTFAFEHPAVDEARDLMHVTLECPTCDKVIKAPEDSLTMIPMADFMRKKFEAMGLSIAPDETIGHTLNIETGEITEIK